MKLTRFLSLALGLTFGAATADEALYTGAFWTEGVSETGGWYDANKIDNSDGDADDNMCYAASAANVIAWWQDSKVGSTLTSEAPKQLDDIWQSFVKNNQMQEEGGEAISAINWWVSGVYMPTTDEEWERHYINREELEGDVLPVTLPADVMDGYYFDPYGLTHQDLADFLVDM